jgi:predicted  nucleic acid-binding Zn-ribbon protein
MGKTLPRIGSARQRKLKTVSLAGRITDAEKIKALETEKAGLLERNADLAAQVVELRAAELLTPAQAEAIATLRREHTEMSAEINKLGIFLRRNFEAEIQRGEHEGMSLSSVIIRYLGRVKHDASA